MEVSLRFEGTKNSAIALVANDIKAEMSFSLASEQMIIIDHTEVNEILRGRGIGRRLLLLIVDHARENNIKIIPLCPYARSVFDKDLAIRDVLK